MLLLTLEPHPIDTPVIIEVYIPLEFFFCQPLAWKARFFSEECIVDSNSKRTSRYVNSFGPPAKVTRICPLLETMALGELQRWLDHPQIYLISYHSHAVPWNHLNPCGDYGLQPEDLQTVFKHFCWGLNFSSRFLEFSSTCSGHVG
jgi:hypothetical protein